MIGIFFQSLLMALLVAGAWTDTLDAHFYYAIAIGVIVTVIIWRQVFQMVKASLRHSQEVERRRTKFLREEGNKAA
jgi:accessory gene regulator protein AgrB